MRTTLAHENEERSKFEGNQVKRRIDFKTQWNEIVGLSRARALFCRFIITQFNLSWDTAIHSDLYHRRADWLTDCESLCVCVCVLFCSCALFFIRVFFFTIFFQFYLNQTVFFRLYLRSTVTTYINDIALRNNEIKPSHTKDEKKTPVESARVRETLKIGKKFRISNWCNKQHSYQKRKNHANAKRIYMNEERNVRSVVPLSLSWYILCEFLHACSKCRNKDENITNSIKSCV